MTPKTGLKFFSRSKCIFSTIFFPFFHQYFHDFPSKTYRFCRKMYVFTPFRGLKHPELGENIQQMNMYHCTSSGVHYNKTFRHLFSHCLCYWSWGRRTSSSQIRACQRHSRGRVKYFFDGTVR